jgi:hypothetical protein
MVDGGGSPVIYIEGNTQVKQVLFADLVVFIDDGLWRGSFLHGLYGDGGPVFIATADIDHIGITGTKKTHVCIRRKICPCQVADMFKAIGIGEGRSDQVSFWRHAHFIN